MKKADNSRYITISPEGLDLSSETFFEQPQKADISYRLEGLIDELETPCVLLVDFGDHAVNTVHACRDAGLEVCVPFTKDMADSPYIRIAKKGVCIGDTFSENIFRNSYAILKAADECNAKAVLFIDPTLADTESFVGIAGSRGIKIFKALDANIPQAGWIIREAQMPTVAEAVWKKCPDCSLLFDEQSLAFNHFVCPDCGKRYRMTSQERLRDILDADSFEPWCESLPVSDPLNFPGYEEKVLFTKENTGLDEAVCCGFGTIAGLGVAVCVMDATFMMGSMGSVVGEKITQTVERATEEELPLLIFTASGGARMQEGLFSLMQMAKISSVIKRHSDKGLFYVSVLTDPTTGGVTASFAMQGDVVFAEPGVLIGFAGQRVIRDTIKKELPEGFQTAEFALEHGLIDAIVERKETRSMLAHVFALHLASSLSPYFVDGERITYLAVEENLRSKYLSEAVVYYGMSARIKKVILSTSQKQKQPFLDLSKIPNPFVGSKEKQEEKLRKAHSARTDADEGGSLNDASPGFAMRKDNQAWQSVQLARNTKRPTSFHYITSMIDGFIELHGDRSFADDGAIICGIGWMDSRPVTIVAQEKGRDLKERLARNFGCPQPEGYRKSQRIMKQAEKFNRAVVCLVDTQGAFCGTEAEERGQGNAIAENLSLLSTLEVPVVSVLLGEGGSGGALALALADRVAMQQNAVYSILSPEGFASILWKDASRAAEAAAVMKISADEAYEMGVIDAVLSEGEQPAHENPDTAVVYVKEYLAQTLDELSQLTSEQLLDERYKRFRKF